MPLFVPGNTFTVGTTGSVQIYVPTAAGTARDVTIVNRGPNSCFLGGATAITAALGLGLVAGGQITIQSVEEAVYAICPVGSSALVLSGNATVASVV